MNSNFEVETVAIFNNSMSQEILNTIIDDLNNNKVPHKSPDDNNRDHHTNNDSTSTSDSNQYNPDNRKHCHKHGKCPKAYVRDGHYYVYIYKNSIYNIGRWGEINYGRDRKNARQTYSMNFQDCSLLDRNKK